MRKYILILLISFAYANAVPLKKDDFNGDILITAIDSNETILKSQISKMKDSIFVFTQVKITDSTYLLKFSKFDLFNNSIIAENLLQDTFQIKKGVGIIHYFSNANEILYFHLGEANNQQKLDTLFVKTYRGSELFSVKFSTDSAGTFSGFINKFKSMIPLETEKSLHYSINVFNNIYYKNSNYINGYKFYNLGYLMSNETLFKGSLINSDYLASKNGLNFTYEFSEYSIAFPDVPGKRDMIYKLKISEELKVKYNFAYESYTTTYPNYPNYNRTLVKDNYTHMEIVGVLDTFKLLVLGSNQLFISDLKLRKITPIINFKSDSIKLLTRRPIYDFNSSKYNFYGIQNNSLVRQHFQFIDGFEFFNVDTCIKREYLTDTSKFISQSLEDNVILMQNRKQVFYPQNLSNFPKDNKFLYKQSKVNIIEGDTVYIKYVSNFIPRYSNFKLNGKVLDTINSNVIYVSNANSNTITHTYETPEGIVKTNALVIDTIASIKSGFTLDGTLSNNRYIAKVIDSSKGDFTSKKWYINNILVSEKTIDSIDITGIGTFNFTQEVYKGKAKDYTLKDIEIIVNSSKNYINLPSANNLTPEYKCFKLDNSENLSYKSTTSDNFSIIIFDFHQYIEFQQAIYIYKNKNIILNNIVPIINRNGSELIFQSSNRRLHNPKNDYQNYNLLFLNNKYYLYNNNNFEMTEFENNIESKKYKLQFGLKLVDIMPNNERILLMNKYIKWYPPQVVNISVLDIDSMKYEATLLYDLKSGKALAINSKGSQVNNFHVNKSKLLYSIDSLYIYDIKGKELADYTKTQIKVPKSMDSIFFYKPIFYGISDSSEAYYSFNKDDKNYVGCYSIDNIDVNYVLIDSNTNIVNTKLLPNGKFAIMGDSVGTPFIEIIDSKCKTIQKLNFDKKQKSTTLDFFHDTASGKVHLLFRDYSSFKIKTEGIWQDLSWLSRKNFMIYKETIDDNQLIKSLTNIKVDKKPITNLYPNPARNYIELAEQGLYEIYSTTGELITKGENINGKVNIENLSSGIYFIHINSNSYKFVKD